MGRRDRNGQRLTFGHIQFTMPGSPSRPNLKIEKLGDREVSLENFYFKFLVQLIFFLFQRYCYCYFSNECFDDNRMFFEVDRMF